MLSNPGAHTVNPSVGSSDPFASVNLAIMYVLAINYLFRALLTCDSVILPHLVIVGRWIIIPLTILVDCNRVLWNNGFILPSTRSVHISVISRAMGFLSFRRGLFDKCFLRTRHWSKGD